jgi:hypothetical protein
VRGWLGLTPSEVERWRQAVTEAQADGTFFIAQAYHCASRPRIEDSGANDRGCALALPRRHSDIWAAAASHSGHMGFELRYLPGAFSVLRARAGADNSVGKSW